MTVYFVWYKIVKNKWYFLSRKNFAILPFLATLIPRPDKKSSAKSAQSFIMWRSERLNGVGWMSKENIHSLMTLHTSAAIFSFCYCERVSIPPSIKKGLTEPNKLVLLFLYSWGLAKEHPHDELSLHWSWYYPWLLQHHILKQENQPIFFKDPDISHVYQDPCHRNNHLFQKTKHPGDLLPLWTKPLGQITSAKFHAGVYADWRCTMTRVKCFRPWNKNNLLYTQEDNDILIALLLLTVLFQWYRRIFYTFIAWYYYCQICIRWDTFLGW
jgi:hypothetical protein